MALAFLLPVKMMAKASSSDNSTLLWYNAPAQQWLEALPIGNSHLEVWCMAEPRTKIFS